jgi:phage/plasmid primase-like uncharacterized protein
MGSRQRRAPVARSLLPSRTRYHDQSAGLTALHARTPAFRWRQWPETLLIAEGIETALSGTEATGLPAWAALSTSGLIALPLPPSVRRVVILADHDVSGAGERAARAAAQRWLGEGRLVKLAIPPEPGSDFNDLLVARASSGMCDVSA